MDQSSQSFLRSRPARLDGRPTCAVCLEIYGRPVKMAGPVSRTDRSHDELFFVCELCNSFVPERRRRPPGPAAV